METNIRKRKRLTLVEWWKKVWGKGYVVNHHTKEIHRLHHKHHNCGMHLMTNREFISKKGAENLMRTEWYDGCRFCWKEEDNG